MAAMLNPNDTATDNNVSPFGNQQQSGGKKYEKSDRLININIPTADGGYTKLAVGGLKASDPDQALLIEWLDEDPETNLPILIAEMARVSTYVDITQKKKRGFDFIKKS